MGSLGLLRAEVLVYVACSVLEQEITQHRGRHFRESADLGVCMGQFDLGIE